jgi:hypothetical protein
VIKRGSKGGCHVKLDLSKDGDQITIDRYRNDKKFGNKVIVFVNGVDVTPSSNFKTQEFIEAFLGASFELFTNLVYITETSMRGSFVLESDTQRKRILVSAFPHLEQFGTARGKVKTGIDTSSSYTAQCKNQITALEEALQELQDDKLTDTGSIYTQIYSLVEQYQDLSEHSALLTDNLKGVSESQCEALLREKVKEVAAIEAQINLKAQEIKDWQKVGSKCKTCHQSISDDFKEEQIKNSGKQAAVLHIELEKLQRERDSLQGTNMQYRNLTEYNLQRQNLKQSIERLQNIVLELEQRQLQLESRKQQIQLKIGNLRALIGVAETYHQSLRVWFDGFGPRGVVSLALESVVETLTQKAEIWLGRLWREGASISFVLTGDDSSRIEAKLGVNHQEVQLTSLSSGETRRLCLAICFGLRESLQTLTGWHSNLLVLDEVFDGIDGVGRDKVLHELQHVPETSIFVISQFPQLSQDIQRRAVASFRNDESQLSIANV